MSPSRNELLAKYGEERIFVVPFAACEKIPDGYKSGYKYHKIPVQKGRFILRADAEYNFALVQPIPYLIVVNEKLDKAYVTKRIAGEERLKDSYALGCGGHINPEDATSLKAGGPDFLLDNGALRELSEELNVVYADVRQPLKKVGTVRDMTSETKEHIGIVYLVTVNSASVKEKDNLQGEWMTFEDLINQYQKFESWGRLIIDAAYESGKRFGGL